MATLSHSESRRLYSWWWDSHISPKNSKWLQENLTDMDGKVKAMIKLIEEDADSFARRAEMYYKKRPELMKLVEEFYRAYRALAERYDHATVELRQAHRTMAEAFPNRLPYEPGDDLPSRSSVSEADDLQKDPLGLPLFDLHTINSNKGYLEESNAGSNKRGLKQLNDMFGSRELVSQGSKYAEEKMKMDLKVQEMTGGETNEHVEDEVHTLKMALAEILAEKEAILLQHQLCLQKLSSLEKELKDVGGLDEQLSKVETEIKILKETHVELEAERDAGLLQYNKCLKRVSSLESMIFQMQEDAEGLNDRAAKAEIEAKSIKQEHSALEAEKETLLFQYNQCLEMISVLEKNISLADENVRTLDEARKKAETEIESLKQALIKLNKEKEAVELQHEQCLERISTLNDDIFRAQEDVKMLNNQIVLGVAKLKNAEEQCFLLERSNQSLQLEADNLAQKITIKDQELLGKENELQNLQTLLKDEHSQFVQVEAAFQALQKLHSQAQEEQQSLAVEVQSKLQMLKNLEASNHALQQEILQHKEENQSLTELNTDLQGEIFGLKELKVKLEGEIALQSAQSDILQQQIYCLKEEIKGLNARYQALIEIVNSVGLSPESFASCVKDLQHENLRLKEVHKNDKDENEVLHEKLSNMSKLLERNVALESSILELNGKLNISGEKVKELQETCQLLQGEKSGFVAEKAILLSQLQMMTENMQKLLEKNALLENSLSAANVELEGLRAKSKSLEELCEMLRNEKSNLHNEKSSLVSQLENVQQRLEKLEIRSTRLEEKYTDLEKEKEFSLGQIKELWAYLGAEKKEHTDYLYSSESRLGDLENQVHVLRQERRSFKKEFEEELDKAVNSQVEIFILQKFVRDLEEKNLTLLIECQKHVEASKLSNKLISELETENLEQQVEVEFLLDEIEKLKIGLHEIFNALQFGPANEQKCGIEEQFPLSPILVHIEKLKTSCLKNEDEVHQLVVENSVLLTLLGQMISNGAEVQCEKKILGQDFKIMAEQFMVLKKDKHELQETNRELRLKVSKSDEESKVLMDQLENQNLNLLNFHGHVLALQEENSKAIRENKFLLQNFLNLQGKADILEEENNGILREAIALNIHLLVLEGFGTEKVEEIKALSEDLSCLYMINSGLYMKIKDLGDKLDRQEVESHHLNETIEKLQGELQEDKDLNTHLYCQLFIGNVFLRQKAMELCEAEEKLKALCNMNSELSRTIEELNRKCEESKATQDSIERKIIELSDENVNQRKEIVCLSEANENLESVVHMLSKEVEERRHREENLTLELQERSNEFELWEAEASSFYFDLQISSVSEVLLKNKVHELTKVCATLEDENCAKDTEIEWMKERFGILENEFGGLKAQLSVYVPLIASLKDDIKSLEDTLLQPKMPFYVANQGPTNAEMALESPGMCHQEVATDETAPVADGISDLLKIRARIKAIGKVVVEEIDRLPMQERPGTNTSQGSQVKEVELLELKDQLNGDEDCPNRATETENELAENSKSNEKNSEISETRNVILMKDIPLDQVSDHSLYRSGKRHSTGVDDQMLELWEFAEQDGCIGLSNDTKKRVLTLCGNDGQCHQLKDAKKKGEVPPVEAQVEKEVGVDKLEVPTNISREPNQEGKMLERLASNAEKLISLQTTTRDLKTKMEMKKWRKKSNDLEFERLKRRLKEFEEGMVQLVDTNGQLTERIQGSSLSLEGYTDEGSNVQVEKESEKIEQMQSELQTIQHVVLQLEGEKKTKGKLRFSGSRTGILLKKLITCSSGSRRQRKSCFCGCGRLPTYED